MKTMLTSRIGFVTATALAVGCGWTTARPDAIAERFWDASRDGDFERAAEYVTAASKGMLERNADAAPDLEEVSLGDVEVDGDQAMVQTQVVAVIDDRPTTLDFNTVLAREDGAWKVDLRKTTSQMIAQFVGGAAGELMGQLGEIVGDQMRGMFDGMLKGLADGMEQAGQAWQEAHADSSR